FGDGTSQTTTTTTVNHIYNNFGNFIPKLILQDAGGCFIPVGGYDTVKVIGGNAKFGFDKNLLCDNGLINFLDSTTYNDPIVNYSWSFGDGGTSNLQNPSHTYTSPGNYIVQLAVQTQIGCKDTLTKVNAIKVVQRPLIDIG